MLNVWRWNDAKKRGKGGGTEVPGGFVSETSKRLDKCETVGKQPINQAKIIAADTRNLNPAAIRNLFKYQSANEDRVNKSIKAAKLLQSHDSRWR